MLRIHSLTGKSNSLLNRSSVFDSQWVLHFPIRVLLLASATLPGRPSSARCQIGYGKVCKTWQVSSILTLASKLSGFLDTPERPKHYNWEKVLNTGSLTHRPMGIPCEVYGIQSLVWQYRDTDDHLWRPIEVGEALCLITLGTRILKRVALPVPH